MYHSIFIDLDNTIWAFSENARESFQEVYEIFEFGRYFQSFDHFYTLYEERNQTLWKEYGDARITKEQLNHLRFRYPLQQVGVEDEDLVKRYSEEFFRIIPTKKNLMPYAREVLEYLHPKYRLYILSNGFRSLQAQKMKSAGIDKFFSRVILSEDIQVHKPKPAIFNFALSATQSELKKSIMIGDNFDADITGAYGVGMAQIYYNPKGLEQQAFTPTHEVRSLKEIMNIL